MPADSDKIVVRKRVHRSTEQVVVGVFICLIALFFFGWAMGRTSYDTFGAALICPVLVLLTIPLVMRSARRDGDPVLVRIVMLALAVKFAGALVRYSVAYDLYGGTADAYTYHILGSQLAHSIRQGHFVVPSAQIGTQFIVVLTGLAYAVVGSTKLGGFFLFAWLGFLGQYLFYRAFRIGFPAGDMRRYALLVFFLPSEVFWPASLGKESWMTLMLGIFAYGAAKMLGRRHGGFLWVAVGLWGAGAVRPHVALIGIAALCVVYPFRRARAEHAANPAVKAAGLLALTVAALLILQKSNSFFGVQALDPQTVTKVLQTTATQTSIGGSAFTPHLASNPVNFPIAFVTVLFRPFPQEAHNFQALLAAAEGVFLMALIMFSFARLRALPKLALRHSYLLFSLVYVLAFVFAFSSVGNFGILVRERVQVLPFLMVPLCVPAVPKPQHKKGNVAVARAGAS